MKKIINFSCFTFLIVGIFLLFITSQSMADIYCVSNEAELILALNDAEDNASDDVIRIQQGTYYGNFVYDSTESFDLTVEGGYTAGCTSRDVDATNTVLEAQTTGRVFEMRNSSVSADFMVDGITIQRGYLLANGAGAGLFAFTHGTVTLTNNTIRYNSVINDEDGGAGAFIQTPWGAITLINNTIISNSNNSGTGGGIYIRDAQGAVTLTKNIISHNSANIAGGVYIDSTSNRVTFTNNIIRYNRANHVYGGGGIGIFSNSGTVTLTNNIINNNSSNYGGYGGGAHISSNSGTVVLTNNTIINNGAYHGGYGGGIRIDLSYDNAILDIYNNIIWNNYADEGGDLNIDNDRNRNSIPSTVNLYNNDFDQNANGTYIQIPFSIDPSNLDDVNPLFVDPANGDFHLQTSSPCKDAGTDAGIYDDIDGDARPHDFGFDIGADEYVAEGEFVDVATGSNHEASIYAIYNAGITTGCSQNPLRFCPEDPVTRAQMAAFIIRALEGEPTTDCDPNNPPFPDVNPTLRVCKYIKRLSELEITTGYPDGTYRPYNTVTRAQMAAFIVRAKEGEPPADYCDNGSPFPDVDSNSPTCKYIKRFFELGITTGYPDGTYRPSNNVIRRQMAAFLARAFLNMD